MRHLFYDDYSHSVHSSSFRFLVHSTPVKNSHLLRFRHEASPMDESRQICKRLNTDTKLFLFNFILMLRAMNVIKSNRWG